ncbi:MAG: YbaK/prolyl-tRNA synthetase associated region [Chloroflexi bacterium]|jgi:prolyl-tRNA editing enzyme YbaK/EbsC (Cys-tRNA(Pro) deacylase)|nr:YbaK/prolyl-tRNA synthetase associated region [Chloroflexota bacterium]
MPEELSASAQKVQNALTELGYAYRVQELPHSTRTAVEAAQAIGCQVAQIVKSLVFRSKHSNQAILVVASGSNRVNEKQLAASLGEPIERATPEFVREQTGFAIGGVPPLAHANRLRTFVDEDLLQYSQVWAAAGTPFAIFGLEPAELVKMTGGEVTAIK